MANPAQNPSNRETEKLGLQICHFFGKITLVLGKDRRDMRWLITALAIASLAGCSQEQWNYAEAPPAEPQPQPTIESAEAAVDPVSAPGGNVTPPTQPEVIIPPEPTPPKVVEPVVVEPLPKPNEPETTPEDPNLSPAEIVARKLISDNPEENLEVLNDALQAWIAAKGDLPEKIGDLVAEELLPMLPMAPQGKIFTIDRDAKTVVLVAKN